MASQAGWYPDPGGAQGLFRYWDGRAWSAATSPHPTAPPPAQSLTGPTPAAQPAQPAQPIQPAQPSSSGPTGAHPGTGYGQSAAYAHYQAVAKKKSPVGWWIGGAALALVIVVIAVIAIRAIGSGGGPIAGPGVPTGQPSQEVCPAPKPAASPAPNPADGRVHGGPLSYPMLGSPWGNPSADEDRVPFGTDVIEQSVTTETNAGNNKNVWRAWVASVLVGELQAGDGFFTPEEGSKIVVKCILGRFYGDNPVQSNITRNEEASIDGHDAWIVESKLTFDIEGLKAKGELLIVAIVATDTQSGLFYASIPDNAPELVKPARSVLADLKVDS